MTPEEALKFLDSCEVDPAYADAVRALLKRAVDAERERDELNDKLAKCLGRLGKERDRIRELEAALENALDISEQRRDQICELQLLVDRLRRDPTSESQCPVDPPCHVCRSVQDRLEQRHRDLTFSSTDEDYIEAEHDYRNRSWPTRQEGIDFANQVLPPEED